jgi:hypothetical protein
MSWITVKLLGYRKISEEGLLVPQRGTINVIGAEVEDDPTNGRTNITFTGGGVQEVAGVAPILVEEDGDAQHLEVSITPATTSAAGSMSAADKTKLDGIETAADVTDATNVAAAGAYMLSTAPVTVTGASETLAAGDNGKVNLYTEAGLVTVTLANIGPDRHPSAASMPKDSTSKR